MAITGLGFACRPHLPPRSPLFFCARKVRFGSVAAVESLDETEALNSDGNHDFITSHGRVGGDREMPEWKKLSSKDLGITASMIARPTRVVLNGLRRKGYDVYLVGGCVRDFILKRTPKDFDIITSAELRQVMRTFSHCEIVGKRFPICHVHIDDAIVEVSSFSTRGKKFNRDLDYDFGMRSCCDEKDYIRWKNCLQRDFTINGLMFDPYANLVYDYMGGMEDIRKAKVRTVIPATTSFQEDCARILRAVRVGARLGFRFTRETAHSVKNLSCTVLRLDKGRLLMEMNYLLAFGSAEASLRLLWKFGLLEILLPIQLLSPDRPCHSSLWVGILAFHKALLDRPRIPLVVAAFCLAVYNGGDMMEAVDIAKRISKAHDVRFHELLEPENLDSEELTNEVLDLAVSVKGALYKMTDEYYVSQAMSEYPQAPRSDLVFIPSGLYLKVCRMFDCIRHGKERGFDLKRGNKIDYELLALGSLQEVRYIFARIVFDTVYPLNLTLNQNQNLNQDQDSV
ncbi:uncharacterized protein LOC131160410 isoform X2 [Malania oleifera]|uniref:uncharacterized protein LOC131160410 isoform X2 n=1 Tax=Malania oleifera TaxID=397392 RepID=UPI0025AE9DFC|nr:uncharacterized protein LOC131160410 isoform X2 [Malania oleifera]